MGQALITRRGVPMLAPDVDDGYEQLINYTMLYDSGDECEEVTGGFSQKTGWKFSTNSNETYGNSSYQLVKNSDNMCLKSYSYNGSNATTGNLVNLTDYSNLYVVAIDNVTAYPDQEVGTVLINDTIGNMQGRDIDLILPNHIKTTKSLSNSIDISAYTGDKYVALMAYSGRDYNVYNIFLTKPDDIGTLCTKAGVSIPASLESLLANTTSLATIFNNEDAVKFMVAQCTGDFMVGVLNSADAVALLKASPYLNLVVANPHWAKFIMMIPTAKGLLNFTMLYDEGDECADATGGWETWYRATGNTKITFGENSIDFVGHSEYNYEHGVKTKSFIDFSDYVMSLFKYSHQRVSSSLNTRFRVYQWDGSSLSYNIPVASTVDAEQFVLLEQNAVGDHCVVKSIANNNNKKVVMNTYCEKASVYNFAVFKQDNWTYWMQLGSVTGFSDMETLLADSTTMAKLMSNEQAVKYLMGCTGDLMVSICNSEVAMAALVNNIAYDYAFAHPVWYKFMTMIPTALAAMDSVAITVPTMTSNTTPSGVASASGTLVVNGETYSPCMAFDKSTAVGNYWRSPYGAVVPQYVQYAFAERINLYAFEFCGTMGDTAGAVSNGNISVSLDGEHFETVYSFTNLAKDIVHKVVLDKPCEALIVRINLTSHNNTYNGGTCMVTEAQFYGKAVN